ncbi:MAG TPA: glycogen debranching N-terminal domain-containing protein, partial [Polyangiaceae bacterium]|nr:glycogen debranching N-terminal domain-containing protein [Polyangiaceae bacterium]
MGSREASQLVLSNGAAFAVLNTAGDIRAEDNPESGLFYDDTRYLSRSTLEIDGGSFRQLSSEVTREYVSQIDLSLSGQPVGGELDDPKLSFHLRRRQLIDKDLVERVELSNYNSRPVEVMLFFQHAADFKDLFEVRGLVRKQRGTVHEPAVADVATYEFRYTGKDGQTYRTRVRYERAPDRIDAGRATFRVRLEPLGSWAIEYTVSMGRDEVDRPRAPAPFARHAQRLTDAHEAWHAESTLVQTDDDYFTQSLERGLSDLYSLCIRIDGMMTITAGIPWFAAPFGRDACVSAFQSLLFHTNPAKETLLFLARYQGKEVNPERDEEPGKILHEYRRGEMARTGETPHRPYYGSVDATPLFLILADEYVNFTDDIELVRTLAPSIEAAARWILDRSESDPRGLVTYKVGHGGRLRNQGWKDSGDGVCFPDGRLVMGPIALVEVQGYSVDALERAARLLARIGKHDLVAAAEARARDLRDAIESLYFDASGACAFAIDGEGTPVTTRTSNPGHLLFSSAIRPERARSIASGLLTGGLWSGWGIRTLSAEHAAYNPLSYHRGSIWPHDNSLIAFGMARFGWTRDAFQVLRALYQASLHFRHFQLPELFCGMGLMDADFPVLYPVACSPQ